MSFINPVEHLLLAPIRAFGCPSVFELVLFFVPSNNAPVIQEGFGVGIEGIFFLVVVVVLNIFCGAFGSVPSRLRNGFQAIFRLFVIFGILVGITAEFLLVFLNLRLHLFVGIRYVVFINFNEHIVQSLQSANTFLEIDAFEIFYFRRTRGLLSTVFFKPYDIGGIYGRATVIHGV